MFLAFLKNKLMPTISEGFYSMKPGRITNEQESCKL